MNQKRVIRLMCVLAEFTPEHVLPLRGDTHALFMAGDFPITVDMSDSRYRVFAESLTCAHCGLTGTVMRLEYNWDPKGWIEIRFNLYAPKGDGWVLMTQDHIVPKSKGGGDEDENLRTMCAPCNEKKGNKLPAPEKIPQKLAKSASASVY